MNKPIWEPSTERIERANMNRFMRFVRESVGNEDIRRYAPLYDFSVRSPEKFWPLVWEFCGIRASGDFTPVLVDGDKMPGARWFPQVRLNFAQNLLRHKDDRNGDRVPQRMGPPARIELRRAQFRSRSPRARPEGIRGRRWRSRRGIHAEHSGNRHRDAGGGVSSARSGRRARRTSACSGVVDRFGQIAPKVLFTADAYGYGGKRFDCLRKIRSVLDEDSERRKARRRALFRRRVNLEGLRDAVAWPEFTADGDMRCQFELLPFDHPLYIMYSSGTTGVPKCIVHGAGGTLLQHLKEHRAAHRHQARAIVFSISRPAAG